MLAARHPASLVLLALVAVAFLTGSGKGAPRTPEIRALRGTRLLHDTVRAWAKARGRPPLQPDPALARVAALNSEALSEVGAVPPDGAPAFLRFILNKQGVKDAVVLAAAEPVSRSLGSQVMTLLDRRAGGEFTHYGIALARASAQNPEVLTVVLVRRLVDVQLTRQPLRLCARLLAGQRPSVLITLPSGRILQRSWGRIRRFCTDLPRAVGRHQVEIMLEGRYGPEVAALFPLYVGMDPPDLPQHKLYPAERHGRHVEIHLMDLVNESRQKAGLAALQPSSRLARVARAHSADMLQNGYFGHRSPTRGDLAQRLGAAGLQYTHASENLALSTGPERAHENLLSSPSHRRTLLDPQLTHLGVGVVRDPSKGILYITQVFASQPEPVPR